MLIRPLYVAITLLLVFATISISVARADDDERKPAVSDAYLYPDADFVMRSYDPGMSGTELHSTKDSFKKVLEFYEKKLGAKGSSSGSSSLRTGKTVKAFRSFDDSTKTTPDDETNLNPRSVKLVTFTNVDEKYVSTVVLSRTKTEERTHILLIWATR